MGTDQRDQAGSAEETSLDSTTLPSEAVVFALADEKDVEPEQLTPLFESIDTDALDALLADEHKREMSHIVVSFVAQGCEVTIRTEGQLTVDRLDADD